MKTDSLILGREHQPESPQRVRPTATGNGCSAPANKGGIYKTGLTLGFLFAGFHLLWICLVSIGWAQSLLNFIFWAHMIQPIYIVKPFEPVAALTLMAFTFSTGFVLGSVGTLLWNNLHRTYE